jgi:hypothetical protein
MRLKPVLLAVMLAAIASPLRSQRAGDGDRRSFGRIPAPRIPVWKYHATPMTFMGRDNRQYVVIAASGDGLLRSEPGKSIVAFGLGD